MTKDPSSRRGRLLMIGGGERRGDDSPVLSHLVEIAGGDEARILICAAATTMPEEALEEYGDAFEALGAAQVWREPLQDRQACESPALLDRLNDATAIFFTGGDQHRLTTIVGGSAFGDLIKHKLERDGFLVAGTSAGAAAMSSTMIVSGTNGGSMRKADVRLGVGLGYMRDAVIDTHFNQRGRIHRLLTVFAQYPQILGIGLDEDTAIDVTLGRELHVLGSGAVTLFDGRGGFSNAADAGEDEPLALSGVVLHVLARGCTFDPRTMEVRLSERE